MDTKALKEAWQSLFYKVTDGGRDPDRDLVITPYFGNYGLDGYVIAVQGSPDHGVAVLDIERKYLCCITSLKVTRIYKHSWAAKTAKEKLYDATIALLTALDLRLITGGEDNPAVYYVKAGAQ